MNIRKIASLLVLLAGLASFTFAQTSLTQTTLATVQNGSPLASSTTVTLAACTGIIAPVLPGTPASAIYIGGEVEGILTWNSSTCSGTVLRGYQGTRQSLHPLGDMVLISVPYQTTLGQGANPQPNGFFEKDPPLNGACTPSATATTPYLNVLTGAQWLCSATTGTWVPGFNNPLNAVAPGMLSTSASVSGAQPIFGPYFTLSGTSGGITSFTIPVGLNATASGAGTFCVYPTGAFTTTAGNNIAASSTAVVGKTLCFTWNPATLKFAASY